MKKSILPAMAMLLGAASAMAQFVITGTDGSQRLLDGDVTFSADQATGDYAVGADYSVENSVAGIATISRRPAIYRVYSQQYPDGPAWVHPYNHYRVDPDDPNSNEYGNVPDPDDPFWPGARIVEAREGETVMFLVDYNLGYDTPANHGDDPTGFITVSGLTPELEKSGSTYNVAWQYFEEYDGYGWALVMPRQAVLIEATAPELDTYAGREFLGRYDGFYIHWGSPYASTVQAVTVPDVELVLRASTLFTLTSGSDRVPGYNYDNQGLYTYAAADGTIGYNLESCRDAAGRDRDGIGIQGDYDPEAWILTALDPAQGGLDNTYRYFFTVKEEKGVTGFAAASNQNGNRFLIEVTTAAGREYWYYNAPIGERTLSRVDADFGSLAINHEGAASKILDADGEVLFKYVYSGGTPQFITAGSEMGTYTDGNGSRGTLVLDGFGEGSFEGAAGSYTIDDTGMNISFTITGGATLQFVIYPATGTYSLQSGQQDNPLSGTYASGSQYAYTMRVTINDNGTADFYFANGNDVYHDEHGVNCVYDAAAQSLSISGFLMGNPDTWGNTGSRTIDFTVSADGNTLVCTTEKIKQLSRSPTTSITIAGTVLTKQ